MKCGRALMLSSVGEGSGVVSISILSRAIDEDEIAPLCLLNRDPDDKNMLYAQMAKILIGVNDWFGQPIPPSFIRPMIDRIIATYPNMYVDDLAIFAERAMAMGFGQLYGQLTAHTIMTWLASYWSERQKAMEEESYAQYLSHKEAGNYSASYVDRHFASLADKKTMR